MNWPNPMADSRHGRDGRDGLPGKDGEPGIRGEAGPRGLTGLQGIKGDPGPTGKPGIDGAKGIDGLKGEIGPQGERGPQGVPGLSGADGLNGKDGKPGPQGPAGPVGPEGKQGRVGPMPSHEWVGTSLRFQLPTGYWGPLVDLKGPQGQSSVAGGYLGGGSLPSGASFTTGTVIPSNRNFDLSGGAEGYVPTIQPDGSVTWQAPPSGGTVAWGDITGKPNFATVATSGDYDDLSNKPTLGTAAATDATAYATAAQGTTADSAVQPAALSAVEGQIGTRIAGVRTITGTTDTPTAADAGFLLLCTNAAGCSLTINGAVFSANDLVYAIATQGQLTFVEGSGSMVISTAETLLTEKANAAGSLIFTGSAAAHLVGQLEPA